tara:strand:+ start:35353 stop:35673 length:321 start_codon:yes stop_codon:yes gene_type:complete
MASITFKIASGELIQVDAANGSSLMRVAVDNGIAGIVAECGGAGSCATCHCYIDEPWFETLDPPDDMERDMLDCVLMPSPSSRLSCQVKITEELDGMLVRLPEFQF